MVGALIWEEANGSSSVLTQKRKISSISPSDGVKRVGKESKKRLLIFLNPDVLDCVVCLEALKIPIFQCDNGHLACSSCCPELSGKCSACALPISHIPCRAIEGVLESICVSCPNAKFGCTKNVTYGKQSFHEKECTFSQCSCPALHCDYTGSYKDLFIHYLTHVNTCRKILDQSFICGVSFSAQMHISDTIMIKRDCTMKLIFAVQCFREPCGVYVTVSCIAPSAPEVGKFSYHLSYTVDGHTLSYRSPEVKMILKVSSETPLKNFMFIPHSLLCGELLKMEVFIKKLNE